MAIERFPIESGHVLMFARAIGDTNAAYSDERSAAPDGLLGVAVPPTFLQSSAQFDPDFVLRPQPGQKWFGSGATPSGAAGSADGAAHQSSGSSTGGEKKTGGSGFASMANVLHAEQRFEFTRPIRVGDVLSATQHAGRTWEKQGRKGGKMTFSESITEYRDAGGELVATVTSVGVATARVPASSEADA